MFATSSIGMSRTTLLHICGVARTARGLTCGMALLISVALPILVFVNELRAITGAVPRVFAVGRAVGMPGTLD